MAGTEHKEKKTVKEMVVMMTDDLKGKGIES